jgi:Homeodomain-like domain
VTGARRWGEAPRPQGRPPVDARIRARVFALALEHPDWGSRRIAREAGASRRSVQRWLAANGVRGTGAARDRFAPYAADQAPPVVVGQGRGSVAWEAAMARSMSPEDHEKFDTYRGAVYESPGVWWTGR